MKKLLLLFLVMFASLSFSQTKKGVKKAPFVWEASNVYFLITDRFNEVGSKNPQAIVRDKPTGNLRGFEGGNFRGIIAKIDDNYFTNLGINAIWLTPVVEQIHGGVNEGQGFTYGFHGYWTKDWSAIDPSLGTREDLKELVTKAHTKGIRVLFDAVINHTGPVTELDPVYPNDWVRTGPKCTYNSYDTYINCCLVDNLPDVLTDSNQNVELPSFLIEKWKKEGRYAKEIASLNAFFNKTGFPRAPKYYIMKWLSDYITDFGIDGYRVDTVKHTQEDVWSDFRTVCDLKFAEYKAANPKKVLDNNPFFLVGEVYGYNIGGKRLYDFGDKKVDYFAHGFSSLINFDFRNEAKMGYEELFSKYSNILKNDLQGKSVMNYVSSHDDSYPFDKKREKTFESGTKLLLAPGISQVYYGDESARSLDIVGAEGDATLRSKMNWNDIQNNLETKKVLLHWQKIGKFRANHPAVGAGTHEMISASPYVFSRTFGQDKFLDKVVIGLDVVVGKKEIPVGKVFRHGTKIRDAFSGKTGVVANGSVKIDTEFGMVLLEKI